MFDSLERLAALGITFYSSTREMQNSKLIVLNSGSAKYKGLDDISFCHLDTC